MVYRWDHSMLNNKLQYPIAPPFTLLLIWFLLAFMVDHDNNNDYGTFYCFYSVQFCVQYTMHNNIDINKKHLQRNCSTLHTGCFIKKRKKLFSSRFYEKSFIEQICLHYNCWYKQFNKHSTMLAYYTVTSSFLYFCITIINIDKLRSERGRILKRKSFLLFSCKQILHPHRRSRLTIIWKNFRQCSVRNLFQKKYIIRLKYNK